MVSDSVCKVSVLNHEIEHVSAKYSGKLDGEGKLCGQGTMRWSSGGFYSGSWNNSKRSGSGNMTWSNGNRYFGNWANDYMEGNGTFINYNNRIFHGVWKKDEMNGLGRTEFGIGIKKGDTYVGQFVNSEMSGKGEYTYANGRKYVGKMLYDLKQGEGAFYWTEGYTYYGLWSEGRITGKGRIMLPNKTNISGEFSLNSKSKQFSRSLCCDSFHVNCFLLYNDMALYVGECKQNQPNGYGFLISGERDKYEHGVKFYGTWLKGKRNGQGLQYLYDSRVYYGQFINNKMNGEGLVLFQNKSCNNVIMRGGIELESSSYSIDKWECYFKVEGRRIVNEKPFTVICDKDYEYDDDFDYDNENMGNEKQLDDFMVANRIVVIEYNNAHCQELQGIYCNQVIRFKGLLSKGLKQGLGMQDFLNNTVYFGNFVNNQMHGKGVMLFPDGKFSCGTFDFDSLDSGLMLYPNKTLIHNMKNPKRNSELVKEISIETGKTQCKEIVDGIITKTKCSSNLGNQEDYSNYGYEGDDFGNGFGTRCEEKVIYRGQWFKSRQSGMGYLWMKYGPVFIGNFKDDELNGPGIRIVHDGQSAMIVNIGYWQKGRMQGPGIAVYPTVTTIGYFTAPYKRVTEINNQEQELKEIKKHVKVNQHQDFLKDLQITKPKMVNYECNF